MRIVVIGTGALASFFCARLCVCTDVVMIGSWKEQIDVVNNNGLLVRELDGTESVLRFPASNNPSNFSGADVTLILTKSFQCEAAIQRTRAILSPAGVIISMQNGIGNLEKFQEAFGRDSTTVASTTMGATMIRPGVVKHAGRGVIHVAKHERIGETVSCLRESGFDVHVVDSGESLLWGKLCINVAINPLTAILGQPNGFLISDPRCRRFMEATASEAQRIADSCRIMLPYHSVAEKAKEVAHLTATNRSSMLQDRDNGRTTEIEAICGAALRRAAERHISAPHIQWLYDVVLSDARVHPRDLPSFD